LNGGGSDPRKEKNNKETQEQEEYQVSQPPFSLVDVHHATLGEIKDHDVAV